MVGAKAKTAEPASAKKEPKKPKDTREALIVHLGIMGNGVSKHCVPKGSTIGQLFEQASFSLGETVRMNGKVVDEKAVITVDNSLVTSTPAVEGG